MPHSTAEAPSALPSLSRGGTFPWGALTICASFFLLWLEFVHQLQSEWSLNPQYSYGWTVPFLGAYLFYQRWRTRPAPGERRFPALTIALALAAITVLLPARLIAVANPDWRLISWIISLAVVLISLCAISLAGGSRWLRHFAFPILFFLTATPWPTQWEQFVVQSLMRADSWITIQMLNSLGTLAVQHGNVIELRTGQVGIDDACTGVRSLQATFMIALFLGEFYRMRLSRRLLLVLLAAVLAFVCNLGRTFFLCQVAAHSGIEAIHRWHDPAGFTILFICLFALWGISLWLRSDLPQDGAAAPRIRYRGQLLAVSVTLLVCICLTETAVAVWYRSSQSQESSNDSWTIVWPTSEPGYQTEAIPEAAATLLRYNEGGAASWHSADDHHWLMYSFHWLPGRTAALFVKTHRPDICLPASGMTMQEDRGIRLMSVNGVQLPIRAYRFDDKGRSLHIFYCYWDGRSSYQNNVVAAAEDWSARGRLRAAWESKRERGARMLELAVWGYENDAEAQTALQNTLTKIVKRG